MYIAAFTPHNLMAHDERKGAWLYHVRHKSDTQKMEPTARISMHALWRFSFSLKQGIFYTTLTPQHQTALTPALATHPIPVMLTFHPIALQ